MGLVEDGSEEAGLRGRDDEYAFLPTSEWTEMIADLYTGNFMLHTELFQLPGTPLPLTFTMTYSSLNATMDIGLGKGWTSSLHACVSEDAQTHDLMYVDGTGAKHLFTWDDENEVYLNPPGFAGEAEELVGGGYTITPLGSGTITFTSAGKLSEMADICGTGKLSVSYDGSGRPESLTDDLSDREITLTWGENGKVTAVTDSMSHAWSLVNDEEALTQDFTTDPNGIILSMTYTKDDAEEGVNGEYYFHYDNFGNTVLLTDEDGVPQYTALYDISNGKRTQEWNPYSLDFAIKGEGQVEKISFEISDIQFSLSQDLRVRKYTAIAISGNKDWIDLTARGGATIKTCGGKCPPDKPIWVCECDYICTDEQGNRFPSRGYRDDENCDLTLQKRIGVEKRSGKVTRLDCKLKVGPVYCYCTNEKDKRPKNT